MNKRGFLLTEETLKIVIAVIGLALLVYFLAALFYSGTSEKKHAEAVSTVEKISESIRNVSGQKEVFALQPQGWSLFGFVGEEKKPNSCAGENCLCICDEVTFDVFDRQIKECGNKGACLILENLEEFETFEIKSYGEGTTNIRISDGEKIKVEEIE